MHDWLYGTTRLSFKAAVSEMKGVVSNKLKKLQRQIRAASAVG